MRWIFTLTAAIAICACGSSSLVGSSGKKEAGSKSSVEQTDETEKGSDPGSSSDDEKIVESGSAVNVSGSFLIECGIATANAGGPAPADSSWYGCGAFTIAGVKLAKNLTAVEVSLKDDDKKLSPILATPIGETRYQVVFALAKKSLGDIASVLVRVDDKDFPAVKLAEPESGAEPAPATDAGSSCNQPHQILLPATKECHNLVRFTQSIRTSDGFSFHYAEAGSPLPEGYEEIAGAFWALRSNPACSAKTCPSDLSTGTDSDGTIQIYRYEINNSAGFISNHHANRVEYLGNASGSVLVSQADPVPVFRCLPETNSPMDHAIRRFGPGNGGNYGFAIGIASAPKNFLTEIGSTFCFVDAD